MKLTRKQKLDVIASLKDPALQRGLAVIDQQLQELYQANSLVAFGAPDSGVKLQNMDMRWLVHTFGATPNAEEPVAHLLGRVPRGLINVQTPNAPGGTPALTSVYFSTTFPSTTMVYLACAQASVTATIILF